jgi:hypothetical protein
MEVFVVISRYMQGIQEAGVFRTRQEAEQHIRSAGVGGSPSVQMASVVGELADPAKVFTASQYDASTDLHDFVGVFGSYESAKQAAGSRGLVLGRAL